MTTAELDYASKEKLIDAEKLFKNARWEGAHYLCGYSLAFKLKSRICKTLNWENYKTGDGYGSFKTHGLPVLLSLSGSEFTIKNERGEQWGKVCEWTPEMRYNTTHSYSVDSASEIINATKILLNHL